MKVVFEFFERQYFVRLAFGRLRSWLLFMYEFLVELRTRVFVVNFSCDKMAHAARHVHVELCKSVLPRVNTENVDCDAQGPVVELEMVVHLLYKANAVHKAFVLSLS